ncbi:uncharacterized protein K452DRAFT_343652 [Aplosporella prunicola CBS 121167]|uniref:Protein NO VEIN C-terminal domain-containing protein n=1 Tax=Aplosporella prunicola CBS 121167 TaxID=1176127 RepID=A0A6A6BPB2_9PEZI|nr:uncharacterized protein K452DRAFT_343652 [Aplosporella prunicola CBS 121167]KAF2145105.1 hypothetical protein K452DRAFT_343652 [Aplosporella prunicola CBS 121167]
MAPHNVSVGEAREHIASIRRARGLDTNSENNMNAEDLHAALAMYAISLKPSLEKRLIGSRLSEQLYQKPTRFIMELIRNADDNEYGNKVPRLTITLRDRQLIIECNEVGFSKRNVEAICRINHSTKGKNKDTDGYVGEKGIGFKSVFKVADVVWISSGNYSFKFDKRAVLGMATPIWESFPHPTKPGYTHFCLQLCDETDVDGIREELLALQPSLLLFLRRLRQLTVNVPSLGKKLTLTSSEARNSSFYERSLSRDRTTIRYLVQEHVVDDMPLEERRPGISNTKILLAFPMSEANEPLLEEQEVFAFLPIRSYGFKFLIQAYFLLVASREDIDRSKKWNNRLLAGIVDAFVQAVGSFHGTHLRYLWPRFLPQSIHPGSFLRIVEQRTLDKLGQLPILESENGTLAEPETIRYVPEGFRDEEGELMLPGSKYSPLSHRYSNSDIPHITRLGVESLRCGEFLNELKNMVNFQEKQFQNKPEKWHNSLAKTLVTELSWDNPRQLPLLRLIPLENGLWSAAKNEVIFFQNDKAEITIPPGLEVKVASVGACRNPFRRNLFVKLGFRVCDTKQICQAILEKHASLIRSVRTLASVPSLDEAVKQVYFLYSSQRLGQAPRIQENSIQFHAENNTLHYGSNLYLSENEICPLKKFLGGFPQGTNFLSSSYLEQVPSLERKSWFKWLRDTFGMSSIPRLANRKNAFASISLTPQFEHIIATCASQEVLTLVRDHWNDYAPEFKYSEITSKLESMKVACKGGSTRPLRETYLPTKHLLSKVPPGHAIPFLDIETPEETSWLKFSRFGVRTTDNVSFYLSCLQGLRTVSGPLELRRVVDIYERIQVRLLDYDQLAQKEFRSERLIYLPPKKGSSNVGSWAKSTECRWDTPACINTLFKSYLEIPNADIHDVINELKGIKPIPKEVQYVRSLFTELNTMLKTCKLNLADVSCLKSLKIFPVKRPGDSSSILVSGLEDWFVADRSYFRASFDAALMLLDFPPEAAEAMAPLFKFLGLGHKILSGAAAQEVRYIGDITLDEAHTTYLRSKAEHLIRLTPVSQKNLVTVQLAGMRVYAATNVTLERHVKSQINHGSAKPQTVYGKPEEGRVVFELNSGKADEKASYQNQDLSIFIAVEDLKDETFPPYQLADEFIKLFCIENSGYKALVPHVISTKDPTRTYEMLERHEVDSIQATPTVSEDKGPDKEDVVNSNPKPQRDRVSPKTNSNDRSNRLSGTQSSIHAQTFGQLHSRPRSQRGTDSLTISSSVQVRTEGNEEDKRTGFEGEKFMYQLLKNWDDSLTPSVWTSHFRERDGHAPFSEDSNSADFTICAEDKLKKRLVAEIAEQLSTGTAERLVASSDSATFHIEVKGTKGPCELEFFLSDLQWKMAREYTCRGDGTVPEDIYILVRVFNIDSTPQYRFYVDPWNMYMQGELSLRPQGEYIVSIEE